MINITDAMNASYNDAHSANTRLEVFAGTSTALAFIGLIENGLIATLMILDRRLRQNSTVFFILSLSCNDLFFCLTVLLHGLAMWFDLLTPQLCVWLLICFCIFYGVSHELSLLIAIERYLAITSKTTVLVAFSDNKKYIYVAAIWTITSLYFSIIMNTIPVANGSLQSCSLEKTFAARFDIAYGLILVFFNALKIAVFVITTMSVYQLRRRFIRIFPGNNEFSEIEDEDKLKSECSKTVKYSAIVFGKAGLLAVAGRPAAGRRPNANITGKSNQFPESRIQVNGSTGDGHSVSTRQELDIVSIRTLEEESQGVSSNEFTVHDIDNSFSSRENSSRQEQFEPTGNETHTAEKNLSTGTVLNREGNVNNVDFINQSEQIILRKPGARDNVCKLSAFSNDIECVETEVEHSQTRNENNDRLSTASVHQTSHASDHADTKIANKGSETVRSGHMRIHDARRETRLATAFKTVILVQISFLLLLCPSAFVHMMNLFHIDVSRAQVVTNIIVLIHPIMNPFIYIWRFPKLRERFLCKRRL